MENILLLVIGFLIAALMGQVIIPRILLISLRKRLFDVPDARKVHTHPIPRLGGLTFFPTIVFVLCFMLAFRVIFEHLPNEVFQVSMASEMLLLVAGMTLLYIVGIGDDLVGVRYKKKFYVQIASASLFPVAGLYINDFYGLLGIHAVTPWLGIPLTVLLVVFITNAINLIDGIDGLASSICIVALSVFGIIFAMANYWMYALLAFTSVGVLIPFFGYNVFGNPERGRKIFMGDTGSLTLGYILSFLVIKYCMHTDMDCISISDAPIAVAFSILLVPCLDVIRVVLGRVRRGKSPFLPDKTHIHHKFMAMGFTPRSSLILLQVISTFFILSTLLAINYHIDINLIFVFDVAVWTLLNIWFSKVIHKKS